MMIRVVVQFRSQWQCLVPKRTHWGMYFMISYNFEEDTKYWEMC